MKVVIVGSEDLKEDLVTRELQKGISVIWADRLSFVEDTSCYIDLLFDGTPKRVEELVKTGAGLIVVNDVCHIADELPENFIRINAWPGFLKREIIEASLGNEINRSLTEKIFSCFGKTVEWVPGTPGFVAPRVISMIINEAYLALEENVSTKQEIDTAMKSGTNYPYGPFEWAEIIGLKNVYALLEKLSQKYGRFQPAALLKKEAFG